MYVAEALWIMSPYPVNEGIISLMKFIVIDLLRLLLHVKPSMLILLAEKIREAFKLPKCFVFFLFFLFFFFISYVHMMHLKNVQ